MTQKTFNSTPSPSLTVALIANGAIHNYTLIAALIEKYDYIIAVDGGLVHCEAMNIKPNLIIGDLDSIPSHMLEKYLNVPLEKFPSDKDETDMELAIKKANLLAQNKVGIFGALEKRTDHALGNLYLLSCYPQKTVIETDYETLFILQESQVISCRLGQTISLLPLGSPCYGVTTKNLKWNLLNKTLNSHFMSLSNICLDSSFEVHIESGYLICCLVRN